MNEKLRRTWPAVLTTMTALLYAWIGLTAHGWNQILGLAGALVIVAALTAAPRSRPAAMVLLMIGAVPLAIATWWSIVTPVLAIVALGLGWFAIRNLSRRPERRAPLTMATAST